MHIRSRGQGFQSQTDSCSPVKMNQQQRAGKHPSFSRDRKPYGMKRETFYKRNTSFHHVGHSHLEDGSRQSKPKSNQDKQAGEEEHLHLVAWMSIMKQKHDRVLKILPQLSNRKLLVCVLMKAAKDCQKEYFLSYVEKAYAKGTRSPSFCLRDALYFKQWLLAEKLMTWCTFSTEEADDALSTAVLNEQWQVVQVSLKHKVSRRLLQTTLIMALACEEWNTVGQCLDRGADLATACTENGFDLNIWRRDFKKTVLHDVIDRLSLTHIEQLLRAGVDPDVTNSNRETVMHLASIEENWGVVRLLLKYSKKAGEIASKRTKFGDTLLHIVCQEGQAEILHTLLLMGANPLVTTRGGSTLLMTALEDNNNAENLVRILVQAGAATHQQERSRSRSATFRKSHRILDGNFRSPLWRAIEKRQLRTAKMLYAAGGCCNAEVHELATSESIREKMERWNRPDILDFLNEISSHPRSLLDSCVLKISHLIGCGPQRDVRAASLGLPDKLRGLVLQDHVVNPDFLKDCPPDTSKTDFSYVPLHVPAYAGATDIFFGSYRFRCYNLGRCRYIGEIAERPMKQRAIRCFCRDIKE